MDRKALKTTFLTLIAIGAIWAFADWMVLGMTPQGEYELRYFGKSGPKCCLYKLGARDSDTESHQR